MTVSIATIQRMVCAEFGINLIGLLAFRKAREFSRPRQVACYLAKELTTLSLPEIGRLFDRDHTTVQHAHKNIIRLLPTNPALAERVQRIREACIEADGPPAYPTTIPARVTRVTFSMNYPIPVNNGVSRETVVA